jgi:hypothetical protein
MEKLQLMLHCNEISFNSKLFKLVKGQLFNGKLQDLKFASVEYIAVSLWCDTNMSARRIFNSADYDITNQIHHF